VRAKKYSDTFVATLKGLRRLRVGIKVIARIFELPPHTITYLCDSRPDVNPSADVEERLKGAFR
jgi:hypothetical protein